MRSPDNPKLRFARRAGLLAVLGLLVSLHAASATAQEVNAVRDIERAVDSLRDRIEQPPRPDVDVADTAIILTNLGNRVAPAICAAFDYDGNPIGRARLRVPALGLRWLLASDISGDKDFIGSAHCFVTGHVAGSAIFLGPSITDLPVRQANVEGAFRLAVPVVVHY